MANEPQVDEVLGEELLDIRGAMAAVRVSELVIRNAIKRHKAGDPNGLPAFIPQGRNRAHPGRGQGYRIRKADLHRWYFGEEPT